MRPADHALLSALLAAASGAGDQDCALSEDAATEPDSYAELRSRFAASFADAGDDSEVAAARRSRNELRQLAPRTLASPERYGPDLTLSTRFCGLRYSNASEQRGSVDCQPDTAAGFSSDAFLAACYDVAPEGCESGRATCCSVGDLGPGTIDMPKYLESVAPSLAAAVFLAVAWPSLCLLWYLVRRWCGLFGGKTPSSKCQCPCFGKRFAGYSKRHVALFRWLAVAFCALTLATAVISLFGNMRVSAGLSGATEALLYDLSQLAVNFDTTLRAIARNSGGGAPSPGVLAVAAEFKCSVAAMQKGMEDSGGSALLGRAILAPTVGVLPFLPAAVRKA